MRRRRFAGGSGLRGGGRLAVLGDGEVAQPARSPAAVAVAVAATGWLVLARPAAATAGAGAATTRKIKNDINFMAVWRL